MLLECHLFSWEDKKLIWHLPSVGTEAFLSLSLKCDLFCSVSKGMRRKCWGVANDEYIPSSQQKSGTCQGMFGFNFWEEGVTTYVCNCFCSITEFKTFLKYTEKKENHGILWNLTLLSFCSCTLQVIVTQSTADHSQPQVIKNLHKGDYFGEKALIRFVHTVWFMRCRISTVPSLCVRFYSSCLFWI